MKTAVLSIVTNILRMLLERFLTQIISLKVTFTSIVKWPMVSFLAL